MSEPLTAEIRRVQMRMLRRQDGCESSHRGHDWHVHEPVIEKYEYALRYALATLDAARDRPGLDVAEASVKVHPGQHEFRTTCRLCGEDGMLHVSLITHHERVAITDPRAEAQQREGAG